MIVSISGGQDSSFLLFCLSFLQAQLSFKCKIIWCNHFWQIDSFYTTLHLTKSALGFSCPIVKFLSFQGASSPLFYKTVATKYKKNVKFIKNKLIDTKGDAYTQQEQQFLTKQKYYKKKSAIKIGFAKQRFLGQRHLSFQTLTVRHRGKTYKITGIKTSSSISALHQFFPKRWRKSLSLNTLQSFVHMPCSDNVIKPKAYKKAIEKISETRARNWRHITIERGCTFYNSNNCVYGHTLSDRVETILFNLIRGTGSKGVQSLPSKRRHSTFCYNKFYPALEQVRKNTHVHLM